MIDTIVQSIRATLMDTGSIVGEQPIRVVVTPLGISVQAAGYGRSDCDADQGLPVFVQLLDGELVVAVWSDINQRRPTHRISLAGARVCRR